MDIYRKELNEIYSRQRLEDEELDVETVEEFRRKVQIMVELTGASAVITDIARDESWFIPGTSAAVLELSPDEALPRRVASSDEDFLYSRMYPEDLVDLRMLEYELFKLVDALPPEQKLLKEAVADIRFGKAQTPIAKSTKVLALSPSGKIWLMLCCYRPLGHELGGVNPRIVDYAGGVHTYSFARERRQILTSREKEVLGLIREGLLSKEIAERLHLSPNTVNRHRQNILAKLSVGNSLEAVKAATAMRLL